MSLLQSSNSGSVIGGGLPLSWNKKKTHWPFVDKWPCFNSSAEVEASNSHHESTALLLLHRTISNKGLITLALFTVAPEQNCFLECQWIIPCFCPLDTRGGFSREGKYAVYVGVLCFAEDVNQMWSPPSLAWCHILPWRDKTTVLPIVLLLPSLFQNFCSDRPDSLVWREKNMQN